MELAFYVAAAVAVAATALALTRPVAVHALLYLIVSFLSVALVMFLLGAPFAAALEVIVYAGAILVLLLFAIMLLDLGPASQEQERRWLQPRAWLGPGALAAVLAGELLWVVAARGGPAAPAAAVEPGAVGAALYGPYLLGVELAGMLLLAGMVGAFHLGRRGERGSGGA